MDQTIDSTFPQTTKQNHKTIFIIVGIISLLALFGIGGYLIGARNVKPPEEIVNPSNGVRLCTEEAKICPDGTAVGRTGPNCEFSPCPIINKPLLATPSAANDSTASWKKYSNKNLFYSLKYPPEWEKLEENDGMYTRFFKGPYDPKQPLPETYVSITVKTNPTQQPLKDWLIKEQILPVDNNISTHIQDSEVNFGGLVGIQISTPVNGGQDTVYLPMDNNIFQITYVFNGESLSDYDNLRKTFNQILTTLQFLPALK